MRQKFIGINMDDSAHLFNIFNIGKSRATKRFVLAVTFISLVISNGPEWINAIKSFNQKATPKIEELIPTDSKSEQTQIDNLKCISLIKPENNIETKEDKTNKVGDFYIPSGSGKTWEGTVWFKKSFTPNFKKIFVEYEITSEKNYTKPPSFIFTVVRNGVSIEQKNIAKIWAPEFSLNDTINIPQLIGFSKKFDEEKHEWIREKSFELTDAVKANQVDSFTVEKVNTGGNEMILSATYKYTSDRTGLAALPFSFPLQINFPFSDLTNSREYLDLGIGTFVKHKLRIVTLDVCYEQK